MGSIPKPPGGDRAADAVARNDLGRELMSAGKFDAARDALSESITLDPGRASAWTDLGVLLARQAEPELAAAAFVTAIAISRPGEKARDQVLAVSRSGSDFEAAMAAAAALQSPVLTTPAPSSGQ